MTILTPNALAVLAARANELTRPPTAFRPGQAAWAALCEMDEPFATSLQGTGADPYADDSLLPAFWQAVTEAAIEVPE